MERWQGRVAVVTGASAGIGAAIAYQLQDAGVNVVGLARRENKIQSTVEEARKQAENRGRSSIGKAASKGKLHFLHCDVQKEEDIIAAFQWIKTNLGAVHILVNNAGADGLLKLDETNTPEWRSVLDTNVLGLSICTREAIQLMRASGVDDGHIIHIGSIYIDPMSFPGISMYLASKQAVKVLTEGLRKELVAAKSKIRVTIIVPGSVNSGTRDDNPLTTEQMAALGITKEQDMLKVMPHLQPEDVADTILYAIATPSHVQIHEIIIRPVGETF